MTKKTSRIIATILLILAIAFLCYAFQHPEGSFPWSNTITLLFYGIYIITTIVLFISPFHKKTKSITK